MTAAAQQAVEAPKSKPTPKTKEKLSGFALVESIAFCGKELMSVTFRDTDTIQPARLEPDATAVVISSGQRADGLLLRKRHRNLATQAESIEQHFVPFANIRGIAYGE